MQFNEFKNKKLFLSLFFSFLGDFKIKIRGNFNLS